MARLQCVRCGAKSASVANPAEMSAFEQQAIAEFQAEHDTNCIAGESLIYPHGATEIEKPVVHVGAFGSPKPPPQSTPNPHGHFEYTGPYGELQTGDTLSCAHCGRIWEVRVGSGKIRGFCSLCFDGTHGSGHTCGRAECDVHIPKERRIENNIAGRPILTPSPPQILVPRNLGDDNGHPEIVGATASGDRQA
jgi:hypothetical protein